MTRIRAVSILILAGLSIGCSPELNVPEAVIIHCSDDRDCPAPRVCVEPLGRCMSAEAPCIESSGVDHVPVRDGNGCSLPGGQRGVCNTGVCVDSTCGDGILDPAREQCDDGNNDDTDNCVHRIAADGSLHCELAICGDGFLHATAELCDDGNTESGDGCRADCLKVEECGDGVVDTAEECDDANQNPNDGCAGCRQATFTPRLLVGAGTGSGDPLAIALDQPYRTALDRAGNLYVVDEGLNQVFRLDAVDQIVTVVAGTGEAGFSGDGGNAINARLWAPSGVAVDSLGSIYIADGFNARVRHVDANTGVIETVAGNGVEGFGGDGGPAVAAELNWPGDVEVDGAGNLYIACAIGTRVRRVDAITKVITTVAGAGGVGGAGDGMDAYGSQLDAPQGIALEPDGTLLIADTFNCRIRRVDPQTNIINTVVGMDVCGLANEGDPALAAPLLFPQDVVMDGEGNLFIAESSNHRVIKIDAMSQTVSVVTGTGTAGYSGDGGPAADAEVSLPTGVAVTPSRDLIITDRNNERIRRVDPILGTIDTVVGGGMAQHGEGGAGTGVRLTTPRGVALHGGGLFYVEEMHSRIRRLDLSTGIITTVAGSGLGPDGGPALGAQMWQPTGLAIDSDGNVFVAQIFQYAVRRIDANTGLISTVIDGSAGLGWPQAVAVAGNGDLFVSDSRGNRVLKRDALTGNVTTFAGAGAGDCSYTGPATGLLLNSPFGLAVHGEALLVADGNNYCVRRIDLGTGESSTIIGTGTPGNSGDGFDAATATVGFLGPLAVDIVGNIYLVDAGNRAIRRVDAATNVITTVVGSGAIGVAGDGGLATTTQLATMSGLAVGDAGDIYFSETNSELDNDRIRHFDPTTGILTTIVGEVDGRGVGPFAVAKLGDPRAMAWLPGQRALLIADGATGRLRRAHLGTEWLDTVVGYPNGFLAAEVLPPLQARHSRLLLEPSGIVAAPSRSEVFVTESNGYTIRRVTLTDPAEPTTWTIETVAGVLGEPGHTGTTMGDIRFRAPAGLAYEPADPAAGEVLYVADAGAHVVRAIHLGDSSVSTIAGKPGVRGFFGDIFAGTLAVDAELNTPRALAIGPNALRANGSLYIADTGNHRVRRVDLDSGIIETVTGDGAAASGGLGAPARYLPIAAPAGLMVDRFGNLFATGTYVLRRVTAGPDGFATGDDYVDTLYGAPPRDAFPMSLTNCLTGVAPDPDSADDDIIYLLDRCQGFLMILERSYPGAGGG